MKFISVFVVAQKIRFVVLLLSTIKFSAAIFSFSVYNFHW